MVAVLLGRFGEPQTLKIPLFMERVAAGFPSPAQDYIECSLDLNELCIKRPAATFFVRAEGESMVEAGIFSGDILIVDRSLNPVHGDIVIASVDGEFTVKRLSLRPSLRLEASNTLYSPIELSDESELEIFGVVTNVIHSLR
ncbi:translesion error-prone DNA polymerase V autoproteolytic subunit [Marinobacterium aestuariivivens]|uniref:Translesion error-prone DNA polymerase V autoproteolytic subunit n=1 Tax=Marinobacterium aestuariivivens TaxID=1698799 RepID=A0ABW2A751_9GAMM